MPRRSAKRRPAAVRIAASGAARGLRTPINIDGFGEGAAVPPGIDVSRPRHDRAVASIGGISPADRRAGGSAVQRLNFGRVSPLPVLVVERGADPVTDQAADTGAD